MTGSIQLRLHASPSPTTLLYLPGMHGDWTLLGPFRRALGGRTRLAELTYPRRADWRLEDYAGAVEQAVTAHGLQSVWLLAESFSSQVAWMMIGRVLDGVSPVRIEGMILAGGFVRHPWPWGVHFARSASSAVPRWLLNRLCTLYGKSAFRRCSADGEVATEIADFVRRRTEPEDRSVMTSRYRLIAGADLRPVACRTRFPVFHLSGAIDPIVPWWLVRRWLEQYCPGFRASQILPRTGHNHLLDAPMESADQILAWIPNKA